MLEQWNMRGHSVSIDQAKPKSKDLPFVERKMLFCSKYCHNRFQILTKVRSFSKKNCSEQWQRFKFAGNKRYVMIMIA